jgi:hypothetical protein
MIYTSAPAADGSRSCASAKVVSAAAPNANMNRFMNPP